MFTLIKRLIGRALETVLSPLFLTVQTGRTIEKYLYFIIADSAHTLREINLVSLNEIGLAGEVKDLTALQDAIKGSLAGVPSAPIKGKCRWDTSAAVAAPTSGQAHALSGAATVLLGLTVGDNVPRTVDIRIGQQHAWETGEWHFGLQRATATNTGYILTKCVKNGDDIDFELEPLAGSAAPSWSTAAAFTAGS